MPPRGVHRRRPAGHRGSSCDGAVTPGRTRQPRPPPPRRMNGGTSVMARSVFPCLALVTDDLVGSCGAPPGSSRGAGSEREGSFCSVNRPSGHDPACSGPPRRRWRDASSAPAPFTVERPRSVGASLLPGCASVQGPMRPLPAKPRYRVECSSTTRRRRPSPRSHGFDILRHRGVSLEAGSASPSSVAIEPGIDPERSHARARPRAGCLSPPRAVSRSSPHALSQRAPLPERVPFLEQAPAGIPLAGD